MAKVVIEQLAKRHDRAGFDCGNEELNSYLQKLARQHQQKGFSRTWVAVREGETEVLGFVTLSAGHVALAEFPAEWESRKPKHPVPVLHIGRLATSVPAQGRGIGTLLLRHAIELALQTAESIGVFALELVAIDEAAKDFYLRRGFQLLDPHGMRLYLPISTLKSQHASFGS